MATRIISGSSLNTFRDSSGLRRPLNENDTANAGVTAGRRGTRRSSRNIARRAANEDVGFMSIDEVEVALANSWVDEGKISLLSLLQDPVRNKADVAKEILSRMSDYAEEHAVQMALVWRYVKEHEMWKCCTNPQWRTEESFLNSLDACQTARICIQFGTSTDAARRGKLNIIQRNWGKEWYAKALHKSLLSESQQGARSLSKNVLRLIAEVSNSISVEEALDFLEKAVQERTAVGSRMTFSLKEATTQHIMLCDLKALTTHIGEAQGFPETASSSRKLKGSVEDEVLELRSSKSFSRLAPFESPLQAKIEKKVAEKDSARNTSSKKRKKKQSQARYHSRQEQRLNIGEPRESREPREPEEPAEPFVDHATAADDMHIDHTGTARVEIEHAWASAAMASHSNKRKQVGLSLSEESSCTKRPRLLDIFEGVEERNSAQQPTDGTGDGSRTEVQSPSFGQHGGRDVDPASSTKSSIRDFMETVIDGSALRSLDQHDRTAPHRSKEDDRPFQECLACGGNCSLCEIPQGFEEGQQRKLSHAAHRALELEATGPYDTVRKWIQPLRYARQNPGVLQGPGEVCVLTAESFISQIKQGCVLAQPLIIKEDFADSTEWTLARYADQLEAIFADIEVDVRWHRDPEPKREVLSRMVHLCRAESPTGNPPNMLNLPDVTGALSPSFLRADRFRFLDLMVERCKAEAANHLGKQLHPSPFDTGSCRRFNIFGWPGAFSGAHVDSHGSTWVRNLFGHKLWMFVPESLMTPTDWDQLARDGDDWDPGDKARAVLLEPDDVFVMRADLVHAVLTLGDTSPSLMIGGFFWDDQDLLHTLQTYLRIGKNQRITNELMAYRSAQIIASLDSIVERNPKKFSTDEGFIRRYHQHVRDIRRLGCECSTCDEGCRCAQDERRCTPLCRGHNFIDVDSRFCMSEQNGRDDSDEDNQRTAHATETVTETCSDRIRQQRLAAECRSASSCQGVYTGGLQCDLQASKGSIPGQVTETSNDRVQQLSATQSWTHKAGQGSVHVRHDRQNISGAHSSLPLSTPHSRKFDAAEHEPREGFQLQVVSEIPSYAGILENGSKIIHFADQFHESNREIMKLDCPRASLSSEGFLSRLLAWEPEFSRHVLRRIEQASLVDRKLRDLSIEGGSFSALVKLSHMMNSQQFVTHANRVMFRRHKQAIKEGKTVATLRRTSFLRVFELKHLTTYSQNSQQDVLIDFEISQWINDKDGSVEINDGEHKLLKEDWNSTMVAVFSLQADEKGFLMPRQ